LPSLELPGYGKSSRLKLRSGTWTAGRMYLSLLSRHILPNGDSETHNALASLGEHDTAYLQYEERIIHRSVTNAHYTEQERSRGSSWVWTVGPDGRVYSNRAFNSYEISVRGTDGELVHVIEREYESLPRPDWHFRELQEYYDNQFAGRQIRGFPLTYEVSRTDPDIEKLFAREDGGLWVLSSRGAYDKPDGVLGVFDVFDADGRFERQVFVHGEGDFFTDKFYLSQGLLIVIRNATIDLSPDDDDDAEDLKYEVICYRL